MVAKVAPPLESFKTTDPALAAPIIYIDNTQAGTDATSPVAVIVEVDTPSVV